MHINKQKKPTGKAYIPHGSSDTLFGRQLPGPGRGERRVGGDGIFRAVEMLRLIPER